MREDEVTGKTEKLGERPKGQAGGKGGKKGKMG